jgi:hypothetical protein
LINPIPQGKQTTYKKRMKQKQIKKLNTSLSKKNRQKKLPKEINSKAVGRKTNKNDETIK